MDAESGADLQEQARIGILKMILDLTTRTLTPESVLHITQAWQALERPPLARRDDVGGVVDVAGLAGPCRLAAEVEYVNEKSDFGRHTDADANACRQS